MDSTALCCCRWRRRCMCCVILPSDVSGRFADVLWGLVIKARFRCTPIHLEGDNGRQCCPNSDSLKTLTCSFRCRKTLALCRHCCVAKLEPGVQPRSDCETYTTGCSSNQKLLVDVMPQDVQPVDRSFVAIKWIDFNGSRCLSFRRLSRPTEATDIQCKLILQHVHIDQVKTWICQPAIIHCWKKTWICAAHWRWQHASKSDRRLAAFKAPCTWKLELQ